MFDKDIVCRAALYPKFISSTSGVFDEEALLVFSKNASGQMYALSVASQFLSGGVDGVHSYGCRAADIANSRFQEKHQRPPKPLTEEVHYLGHYDLEYGQIASVGMEYYTIMCRWAPEHGMSEHFQIEFHQRLGVPSTPKERRRDRTAAIGILASFLAGPNRHLSEKDQVHEEALAAIELPELPRANVAVAAQ